MWDAGGSEAERGPKVAKETEVRGPGLVYGEGMGKEDKTRNEMGQGQNYR
jgi:hypothetical protein